MENLKQMCNKSFRIYLKHRVPPIAELISTEESYVAKLEAVVLGYIKEFSNKNSEIKVPGSLKQHDVFLIFGNIIEIYDWHKNYLLIGLKKHQNSLRELGKLFIENEHEFHMYSKYISNKFISDHLISSHADYFEQVRNKLNHSLSISDLMIEPVQRMPRYVLMLGEILKHLKKKGMDGEENGLREVYIMMQKVSDEANKFMELNAIRNFDGIISEQGKLLHRGSLKCKYNNKVYDYHVFLFKSKIIFTEEKKNKTATIYNFRLQIPINKLYLKELTHRQFFLELQDPNVNDCHVICEANFKDDYRKWIEIIKQQLDLQLSLIHDLVHPSTDSVNKKEMLL